MCCDSWSGPCTIRLTSDSATKLSSSVLITSSTPNRSFSHTGTTTQAKPARIAARSTAGTASAGGRPATCSPTQVAAIAPA